MSGERLALFEGIGIELEYMIVDTETLSVRPIADLLLESAAGAPEAEVDMGPLAWSNELARHVVELKTNGPAASLAGLDAVFQEHVREVNRRLAAHGARLLPSAMHPWMDPRTEFELWPHEYNQVYQTFDRIFGCSGHGWANLQSCHINLPFANDDEFARLHSAIRVVLPIIPALAASSPIVDAQLTTTMDARMAMYRANARRVPSVTGWVVPEPVFSQAEYEREILQPIYRDLEPLDPDGVLRHEWVNARGAITRFDRGAIEIRVIDVQEYPGADLAIALAITSVVRAFTESPRTHHRDVRTTALADILDCVMHEADRAVIGDSDYLALFGVQGQRTAAELWHSLLEQHLPPDTPSATRDLLAYVMERGCLARRIVAAAGRSPDRTRLRAVYARLADCLEEGRLFTPDV